VITTERIISPRIADDGSVHYLSVMSPADDSVAVCHMIPDRVIPVIFVPGVMGSNLMASSRPANPVWLVNSPVRVMLDWGGKGAQKRKRLLDPNTTEVYREGAVPSGTKIPEEQLTARGWGEVAKMSYGKFLVWLENSLNDADDCANGERAALMEGLVANAPGVEPLTQDEVALSYRYRLPVHAVGYNWLQSNSESALRLQSRVEEIMLEYRSHGLKCEKVIVVTHSMGGLVARYFSEILAGNASVLGVVHGVMPSTGSAVAYKRVKAGSEMPEGFALGANAAEMTAVFAQSPGPLQLLPSPEYGMKWLRIREDSTVISLPNGDPYSEIYTVKDKWWGLCDAKLIDPSDGKKTNIDEDWDAFVSRINLDVMSFHNAMSGDDKLGRYHSKTYAFYGDDEIYMTWGEVTWERYRTIANRLTFGSHPPVDDLAAGIDFKGGHRVRSMTQQSEGKALSTHFRLLDPSEPGDGTVPIRSGRIASPKVNVCVPFPKVAHEGAYKGRPQQLFALWAITKVAFEARNTSMAYEE
jgi:pimeloyl-ACP methyl ester carboxylesterase